MLTDHLFPGRDVHEEPEYVLSDEVLGILNDISAHISTQLALVIRYDNAHISGKYYGECQHFDDLVDYARAFLPLEDIQKTIRFIDRQIDIACNSGVLEIILLFIKEWKANMLAVLHKQSPPSYPVTPHICDLNSPEFVARLTFIRNILKTVIHLDYHA